MNVTEPMNVTRRRRSASMSQGPTAADVYPASAVLLAADLATVTTYRCVMLFHRHICDEKFRHIINRHSEIWKQTNSQTALIIGINVKNFHGSLTTVVMAQNDTSKTANITDTIFDRTYWYSPYKRRRFENRWDETFCILLITDVLMSMPKLETKVIRDSYSD